MNLIKKLDELENKIATDLRLQYKAFRICFWTMMGIATVIVATSDNYGFACIVALLGLVSGVVANQKLVLQHLKDSQDNQQLVLDNQLRIEDKLDVMLQPMDREYLLQEAAAVVDLLRESKKD